MSTLAQDVDKAVVVIKSCVTDQQLYVANKYVTLFSVKYPNARTYWIYLLSLSKQHRFDLDNKIKLPV